MEAQQLIGAGGFVHFAGGFVLFVLLKVEFFELLMGLEELAVVGQRGLE
jgi:hypothetical protein